MRCSRRFIIGALIGIAVTVPIVAGFRKHGPFGAGIQTHTAWISSQKCASSVEVDLGETYYFSFYGREFGSFQRKRRVIAIRENRDE